jgi:hypothetical protein
VPQGPILIFDKSALQSLNVDESMWLDNFYTTNITPLFFVETLADLEKQLRSGRTPEQIVGSIAHKTPEMQASANVHHYTILRGELGGHLKLELELPKPVIGGGQPVVLGGSKGLIFRQSPEEEAIARWQVRDFLQIEQNIAKGWRRALSLVNNSPFYEAFKRLYGTYEKPKTLAGLKALVDTLLSITRQDWILGFGMDLMEVPAQNQEAARKRWEAAGKPAIRTFLPYLFYLFSVDMFFYLGMAADLISRERASHKIDIAYLYYLPFCMVFTSNDKLHINIAPLFMGTNQTFVKGTDLKEDLAKLDSHYAAFPENVRNQGMMSFATNPPEDKDFLTTRLWDKHLPSWRESAKQPKEISKEAQAALLELVNRFTDESTPLDPSTPMPMEEVAALTIQRKVAPRKGKWRRFSPEAEAAARERPKSE